MTIFSVRHVTTYRYRQPVAFGPHRMMFRPRDSYDQRLIEAKLAIAPEPAHVRWMHDVFGNCVTIAAFAGQASVLRFESEIRLEHDTGNTPDFTIEEYAKSYPFAYDPEELDDLLPCVKPRYPDPDHQLSRWAQKFLRQGRPSTTGALLMTLTHAIKESFGYARRQEGGTHAPLTTLELGRGSCRDLALLMIEAVRSLGFAARFVSGYIYVPDRDHATTLGGGSTHAWCEVYLPGAGWVEFDPTNGIIGSERLIRVAVGRDPEQAMPIKGTFTGAAGVGIMANVEVQVRTMESSAPAPAP